MNVKTINPLKLPSLPLASRKDLPGCPTIYFVLDGDRILYIGKASNLWQRWTTHHRLKQLFGMGDSLSIAWLKCQDISTLNSLEKQLIEAFQPELNSTRILYKTPSVNIKLVTYKMFMRESLRAKFKSLCALKQVSMNEVLVELVENWIKEAEEKPDKDKGVA